MSYFDDNEGRAVYGRIQHLDGEDSEPRSPTCKHCGKTGLNWQDGGDGWVLMDGKYRVHKCDPVAAHQQVADDFDAV